MSSYIGLHTIPGFTKEMLEQATPALEGLNGAARFVKAYSSFSEGKVVCEWEAASREAVATTITSLGFPYEAIIEVQAICDMEGAGITTRLV